MKNRLKMSIVNQNEIEGEGLRHILVGDAFEVVGVFKRFSELPPEDSENSEDQIVLVCSPADEATLEICRAIDEDHAGVKIVMMAHESDSSMIARAFRAGVDGYISMSTSCASLIAMIQLVALGEKVVPASVVFELACSDTAFRLHEHDGKMGDVNFSVREIDILRGLIRGEPNKIISRKLAITEATVKVHVKSILRKLNVVNRTQAAIWALGRGISGNSELGSDDKNGVYFPEISDDALKVRNYVPPPLELFLL